MNNDTAIVSQLKSRLQRSASWSKITEEYAAAFGQLNPADIAGLDNDQLWRLWTASKFAETGTPSLPTPTTEQWEGVRQMTRLLCDRSQDLGARFNAARAVYREIFSSDQVQLPVLLRTLLILEGGRYGTIAAKSHVNRLMQWAGKPEMDYRNPGSITIAMENVRAIIEEWALKVGTVSLGERACISWHLCEILENGKASATANSVRSSAQTFPDLPVISSLPPQPSTAVYVEMTKTAHQHGGPGWEFGTCLWSPSTRSDGHVDEYAIMRTVSPGDMIIHLNDAEFVGFSYATDKFKEIQEEPPLPGDWAKSKGYHSYYRIDLRDYTPFPSPIKVSVFLAKHRDTIRAEIDDHKPRHYMFSRWPDPEKVRRTQGGYLTKCTPSLYTLIRNSVSPEAEAIQPPQVDPLATILRRYHDEQVLFTSSEHKRRYVVDSIDGDGVFVGRLDGEQPERVTFARAERLVQSVQEAGSIEFMALDGTAAVRNTVLQAEPLALTADQKRVVFLPDHASRLQNFCEALAGMKRENRFYKPAMLLCVLDGIDNGSLAENRIAFDRIAPRFLALLQSLGEDNVTEREAAQPFYHLSNDLFWLHAVRDRNDLMEGGSDGPNAARNKIKYALLKDTYWNLLQDPANRTAIRHQLEIMIMPTPDQFLSAAETAIRKTGFQHPPGLVRRFLGALAAKPFVILTGNSGTGKTQLAKLIAEWLSATAPAQDADPFRPGAVIESDRIKYYVHNADAQSVEFWNSKQEDEAIKVSLPRQMIREWADAMISSHFTQETPARTIREAVVAQSKFSSQLHSFETHLKAAALTLLNAKRAPIVVSVPAPTRYVLVPVGADWTDNRNVVGFVNHLRKDGEGNPIYQATPVLDLLLRATADPTYPYFLILDEMNLSHVERYFSDFLSAMESKKPIPLHHEEHALRTPSGATVQRELAFPANLFVIGTVNVDETTYMFSPKVLDRANVLEFRIGNEQAKDFLSQDDKHVAPTTPAPGAPLTFLDLSRRARGLAEPALAAPGEAALAECRQSLQEFFDLLHTARLEFAFRTIAEITRYLHVDFEFAPNKSEWRWQDCMDAQVLQKILPKLHGSRRRLEAILIALATYCEKQELAASKEPLKREAELNSYPPANPPGEVAFPLSRTKLLEMIEAVRRDQFVSFIQ